MRMTQCCIARRRILQVVPIFVVSCATIRNNAPVDIATDTQPRFCIAGTVLAPSNAPIPRATVRLHQSGDEIGATVATAPTDDKGRFQLSGPIRFDQNWILSAEAPGWAVSTVHRLIMTDKAYNMGTVYLYTPVPLTGRVENSQHSPVAHARVLVFQGSQGDDDLHRNPVLEDTITNSNGEYSLTRLAPGQYTIAVEKEGLCYTVLTGMECTLQTREIPTLRLYPSRLLRGRLLDPDNHPVPGLRIDSCYGRSSVLQDCIRSDSEGRFTLCVPEGVMNLDCEIRGEGLRESTVPWFTDGMNIEVERKLTIRVRAVRALDGAPVALKNVTIMGEQDVRPRGYSCVAGLSSDYAFWHSESKCKKVRSESVWDLDWRRSELPAKICAEATDGTESWNISIPADTVLNTRHVEIEVPFPSSNTPSLAPDLTILRGTLLMGTETPTECLPLLLYPWEYGNKELCGIGNVSTDGHFSVTVWYGRRMKLIPKRHTRVEWGAARDFSREFPNGVSDDWPAILDAASRPGPTYTLYLPPD